MNKNFKMRPELRPSIGVLVMACIFLVIGLFIVIPQAGWFGVWWTFIALIVVGIQAFRYWQFQSLLEKEFFIDKIKRCPSLEERLKKLKSIYQKGYISKAEYEQRKKEILLKL